MPQPLLCFAHALATRLAACDNPAAGLQVREFVEACKAVTGEHINVVEQEQSRPGDYAEACPLLCRLACDRQMLCLLVVLNCWSCASDC